MSRRLISYKGIIHERAEDAPFMGALIIGASCRNNCQDCFNQHLKDAKTYQRMADEIVQEIKQNPFNEGIILGGLEWSEQPDDVIQLIRSAKAVGLKVMLYTGLDEYTLHQRISLDELTDCWVKYGKFDYTKASVSYSSNGIKLASTNQYILKHY